MNRQEFGQFVREARIKAQLTLREAARRMEFSASYLSRVESGDETVSPNMIVAMAETYGMKVEELTSRAPMKAAGVYGQTMRNSADLRALYRLGAVLSPADIEEVLRMFLHDKQGLEGEALEDALRKLRAELPRLRSGSEGLFAAEVKPRQLSKDRIAKIADAFLRKHGLTESTYVPPTPLEHLIDREPDIRLRFDELDTTPTSEPYVLGKTRWALDGKKEIIINSALDNPDTPNNEYRLLFTLGHELFHAIEHLPLMQGQPQAYFHTVNDRFRPESPHQTRAQRSLEHWRTTSAPRPLVTAEDWREWQSQRFSASVLMPEWALRQELREREIDLPVR